MTEKMYYYYIRDKQRRPLVTVCLIQGERGIGKGVAICSLEDLPVKKVGKRIAKDRALKAYWEERTSDYTKKQIPMMLANMDYKDRTYVTSEPKIWFNPILTKFEIKIITEGGK
jgi:hypothetical protein